MFGKKKIKIGDEEIVSLEQFMLDIHRTVKARYKIIATNIHELRFRREGEDKPEHMHFNLETNEFVYTHKLEKEIYEEPMGEQLKEWVHEYACLNKSEYVFINQKGNPMSYHALMTYMQRVANQCKKIKHKH